jgi:hypothetical protein
MYKLYLNTEISSLQMLFLRAVHIYIYNYMKIINLCINIGRKERKGNKEETIDFTIT